MINLGRDMMILDFAAVAGRIMLVVVILLAVVDGINWLGGLT